MGCYIRGNETAGSTNGGEYFEQLSRYYILKDYFFLVPSMFERASYMLLLLVYRLYGVELQDE
jgi:hypothetical protein